MKLDLNKIAAKGIEFATKNPVLCIGTVVGGYIVIKNYIRTKHIEKEIERLRNNTLVQDTLSRMHK